MIYLVEDIDPTKPVYALNNGLLGSATILPIMKYKVVEFKNGSFNRALVKLNSYVKNKDFLKNITIAGSIMELKQNIKYNYTFSQDKECLIKEACKLLKKDPKNTKLIEKMKSEYPQYLV